MNIKSLSHEIIKRIAIIFALKKLCSCLDVFSLHFLIQPVNICTIVLVSGTTLYTMHCLHATITKHRGLQEFVGRKIFYCRVGTTEAAGAKAANLISSMHHAIVKTFEARCCKKATGDVESGHWRIPRSENVTCNSTHDIRVEGVHV